MVTSGAVPTRGVRRALLVALVVLLAVGLAVGASTWDAGADRSGAAEPAVVPQYPAPADGERAADGRPNLVFVLTDDQNTDELRWMPHVQSLLVDEGISFVDNVSPHPLCCPARAELLTGQYAQNNGVLHNDGPRGGYQALDTQTSISRRFAAAGYRTGLVGKYLNGYPGRDQRTATEPGWDLWSPLVRNIYSYERYSFAGEGDSWRRDRARGRTPYVTDAIARRTNAAVRRLARGDDPFVLWSWHVAPHYSPDGRIHAPPPAAPRDADKLGDVEPPSLARPSYNEADVSDQPLDIRTRPLMSDRKNTRMFRGRIRSLQAVDRAVASLVRTLRSTGELEDTYVVFSSDNGYAMGEHRLFGKNVLTREIMRVPLVARGPGIEPGSTSSLPTSLVDLPATFLDLTSAGEVAGMDGTSLAGPMHGEEVAFRDTTLVQTGTSEGDGWKYRGVQTGRYLYALDAHSGDRMLYDHAVDPDETRNLVSDPRYADVVTELEARAARLRDCAGADCNLVFGPDPAPTR